MPCTSGEHPLAAIPGQYRFLPRHGVQKACYCQLAHKMHQEAVDISWHKLALTTAPPAHRICFAWRGGRQHCHEDIAAQTRSNHVVEPKDVEGMKWTAPECPGKCCQS